MSGANGQLREALPEHEEEAALDRTELGETGNATRDRERRQRAAGLYMRHYYEGKTLADAWYDLMPESKTSRDGARKRAAREIQWLRRMYPLDMPALLENHGLGEPELLARLQEQFEARSLLKKRTTRTVDPKTETVVEEIDYMSVRDWKAHDAALGKLMILHGHTGRLPPETPGDKLKRLEAHRQQQDQEAEAKAPRTTIEHPTDISPEEWNSDWAAYQAEKKRQAEQAIRDGE